MVILHCYVSLPEGSNNSNTSPSSLAYLGLSFASFQVAPSLPIHRARPGMNPVERLAAERSSSTTSSILDTSNLSDIILRLNKKTGGVLFK